MFQQVLSNPVASRKQGFNQDSAGEKMQVDSRESYSPGVKEQVGDEYVKRIKNMHMENFASENNNFSKSTKMPDMKEYAIIHCSALQ